MLGGFLNSLLGFIVKMFAWIIGRLASLIIYPIQALVVTAFPALGNYLVVVLNFFTTGVFPMISFYKECFLSVTCCPRELFTLVVDIFAFRYVIYPALRGILMILNFWRMYNGNVIWTTHTEN